MGIFEKLNKSPSSEVASEVTESLESLEATIERGLAHFHAVGRALKIIRDKQLYAPKHRSFTEYLGDRWSFSATHGMRFIEAAEVVDHLQASGVLKLPAAESHARVLAKVAPDQRVQIWQAATESGEESVTAETLEATIAALSPKTKKPRGRKAPKKVTLKGKIDKIAWCVTIERKGHVDASQVLTEALAQLQSKATRKAA